MNWDLSVSWTRTSRTQIQKLFKKKKKKPKLKILSESNLNSLISVKAQPWIKAEILKPKF